MRDLLIKYLKKIHYRIPVRIRNLYMYFVNLVRILGYYNLPLYLYTGKDKTSGSPLKVTWLGRDSTIPCYWMQRIFKGDYKVQKKKKIPVRNLLKYFSNNREGYDLTIIELNNRTRKYAGFLLHRWLEMKVDTREFMQQIKKNELMRRIRKYSLSFERRNTDEDFKFFHQRMYVPYICHRHKESAVICDYKFFLGIYRKKGSQLGFVVKDGEPVAGSFTEMRGDKLRISSSGILDGREDIMRMGVNGAIYYFVVLDSLNKGMESISIGGSSPVLTDGLTRYKLTLGAKAEDLQYFYSQYLWLMPLKDSQAVRNFLKSNPFVHRIKDSLYRSIFIDPSEYEDRKEFIKYIHHISCGNIKGTKIYCFGNTGKIAAWIEEEGYKDFQVLDFMIQH